jgi:hypothetical protein
MRRAGVVALAAMDLVLTPTPLAFAESGPVNPTLIRVTRGVS